MAVPDDKQAAGGRHRHAAAPDLLRNLRRLRVAMFHPLDGDGDVLSRQLQRIGCQAMSFWPPLPALPDTVDLVFCAVRPEQSLEGLAWAAADVGPAIVAVVTYENPTVVDAVLKLGASAVLCSPLRSSGVLSSMVLALSIRQELGDARRRVARLEQKLASANDISDAKQIIMRTHRVSDAEAYRIIREQAMCKRVAAEEVARAIIQSESLVPSVDAKRTRRSP